MKNILFSVMLLLTNIHVSFAANADEQPQPPIIYLNQPNCVLTQKELDQMALQRQYGIPSTSKNEHIVRKMEQPPHGFREMQEKMRRRLEARKKGNG
ncbi:MAG TPA: hypothetical protein VGT41_06400 [Candidatus Babeliales bacterium]|nr:hypothetical protein [Candidatus Babeliales bacterium]